MKNVNWKKVAVTAGAIGVGIALTVATGGLGAPVAMAIGGAASGAIISGYDAYSSGQRGWELVGSIAKGAGTGAISGLIGGQLMGAGSVSPKKAPKADVVTTKPKSGDVAVTRPRKDVTPVQQLALPGPTSKPLVLPAPKTTAKPDFYVDPKGVVTKANLGEATTLYRGDRSTVTPEVVFDSGFKPKGTSSNLKNHLNSNTTAENFVSTSANKEIATDFAGKNGYLYEISSNRGIDINKTLGIESPFPEQMEFSMPNGISSSEIKGAWKINKGVVGDYVPNPNFGGSK